MLDLYFGTDTLFLQDLVLGLAEYRKNPTKNRVKGFLLVK